MVEVVKRYPNGTRRAVGLDLGQASDYSALAIVERIDAPKVQPVFNVRRVERLPLGTPYPAIVEHVKKTMAMPQLAGADLVVDAMGVGMPVVDTLRAAGLSNIVPVKVHGGSEETWQDRVAFVPKRNLVSVLRLVYENGLVKVAASTPYLDALEHELLNYKLKVSASGHDSYEAWRESDHDDLVFALGLACWKLTRRLWTAACY